MATLVGGEWWGIQKLPNEGALAYLAKIPIKQAELWIQVLGLNITGNISETLLGHAITRWCMIEYLKVCQCCTHEMTIPVIYRYEDWFQGRCSLKRWKSGEGQVNVGQVQKFEGLLISFWTGHILRFSQIYHGVEWVESWDDLFFIH